MNDRLLLFGTVVLRIGLWLSLAAAVMFAIGLLASIPGQSFVTARLVAKYPDTDPVAILSLLRVLFLLGILTGLAASVVFDRLMRIVATVRTGDPFVADNARRLTTIGWALLTIQLIDVVLGGLHGVFAIMGVDHSMWEPALGGWIAVLMVFVLARVFAIGARMRDDLDGTV